MRTAGHRRKLSTTVSEETYTFLKALVKAEKAATLAEAVDLAVERARHAEHRPRVERDTAAYFQHLSKTHCNGGDAPSFSACRERRRGRS